MVNFKIKIANKVLDITCFNESTKRYCGDFISEEDANYQIILTKEDLKNESTMSKDGKVYANEEISALYRKIADLFVEEDILVFHGSAFKVNDCSFIVTARSGVGKSTHVSLLKELLKDELTYINDDKPLLEAKEDKLVLYSSPWNGKERRGSNTSAPLKAVIFLNRGLNNTYKVLDNKEDIFIRLLGQIYLPNEKSKKEKGLKLINRLLNNANFYEINVNTEIAAAMMTYERIIKNEIK